jgi:hypothetical protein
MYLEEVFPDSGSHVGGNDSPLCRTQQALRVLEHESFHGISDRPLLLFASETHQHAMIVLGDATAPLDLEATKRGTPHYIPLGTPEDLAPSP